MPVYVFHASLKEMCHLYHITHCSQCHAAVLPHQLFFFFSFMRRAKTVVKVFKRVFSQTTVTDVLKHSAVERLILFNWREGNIFSVTQTNNQKKKVCETCVISKIEKKQPLVQIT